LLAAQEAVFGPADPVAKDVALFDAKRPLNRELQANVPDEFAVAVTGDLIISRPLSQYTERLPAFKAVLDIFRRSDAVYGNLETTIFDARSFAGAPYSWDGDWTLSSVPEVADDLKAMGFSIVSRANNHAQDWGLAGMRETGQWLDRAGIKHAGAGETHGLARAPQYYESARGRVALVSLASTFRPTSESLPAAGASPGRPGISGLHVSEVLNVPQPVIESLGAIQCALHGDHCENGPAEVSSCRRRRMAMSASSRWSSQSGCSLSVVLPPGSCSFSLGALGAGRPVAYSIQALRAASRTSGEL
jgi:hypothetical protein